jgi:hypothetical protein
MLGAVYATAFARKRPLIARSGEHGAVKYGNWPT